MKDALKVVLKQQSPREEVLLTLLAEVEQIVNSRPLTDVSVDSRDNEALTPNHFLIGTSSGRVVTQKFEMIKICHRKQWQFAQTLADQF